MSQMLFPLMVSNWTATITLLWEKTAGLIIDAGRLSVFPLPVPLF